MHISAQNALGKINSSEELFIELFKHGSLSVEIYKPAGSDLQTPHDRYEVYVIISGSGKFFYENKTIQFSKGDYFVFFRPVFNIADASISIGVGLILVFQSVIFKKERIVEDDSASQTN